MNTATTQRKGGTIKQRFFKMISAKAF